MLGLGSNLATGGYVGGPILMSSYISDFTTGGDGWGDYSVQTFEGVGLTYAYNQTIDSTSGWLKVTYPNQDQTNISGIANINLLGADRQKGDFAIISYKVYYVDGGGKWTGTDTDVSHRVYVMGKDNPRIDAPMDATFTVADMVTIASTEPRFPWSASYSRDVYFYVSYIPNDDLPLAGAVFYIKDIRVDVWRP